MFAVDTEMEGSLNCEECILDKQCHKLPSHVYYEYEGDKLDCCPKTIVSAKSIFLINLFRHYKNGHLFEAGGVRNQPSWYLKGMAIIEGAMNKYREHEQKAKQGRTC